MCQFGFKEDMMKNKVCGAPQSRTKYCTFLKFQVTQNDTDLTIAHYNAYVDWEKDSLLIFGHKTLENIYDMLAMCFYNQINKKTTTL